MTSVTPQHAHRRVWIHGASLGDVNALSGLVSALRDQGAHLFVSATTRSGRARWGQLFPEVELRDPPLLSARAARRALRDAQVEVLILELLEIWPAWVKTWARRGVSVIVVDGRVSARTMWARPLLRKSMSQLSLFLAQTALDAERAKRLGAKPSRVRVCGDAKLDSLIDRASLSVAPSALPKIQLFMFGCVRPQDERPLLSALTARCGELHNKTLLIAPRHLRRISPLLRRATRLGHDVYLRSELSRDLSLSSTLSKTVHPSIADHAETERPRLKIILLDTYGELASLYHHAHAAVIGGTFFNRGQNLIEAAVAECAVIYGPRVDTILAQSEALRGQGAYRVSTWDEAISLCVTFSASDRREIGARAESLDTLRGSLARQLRCLEEHLCELAE